MADLRIATLNDPADRRWDDFVAAARDATFCHRAGWKTVVERGVGHDCHFLMALDGDMVRGVLPLAHVRSRLFGSALVSTPFCVYGGPLALDAAAGSALDAAALDLARRLGVERVEYRLRAASTRGWAANAALYATFRKRLAADEQAAFLALPRKRRAMIRKAIGQGLSVRPEPDVDRFYRLYATSVRDLGSPVFPKALFHELRAVFGRDCEVLIVARDGEPLAGVLSFHFRDEVLPYYAGGTAAARATAAHDLMYWEVMRRGLARGCRVFDFGRSKRGTGAFAYKRIWGFEPTPLHHEHLMLKGGAIPERNPLNPRYALAVAAWKRLPLPVANTLGPMVSRGLG
jgi:FemAB-related protein (PEP-CTERM system-associated)